MYKRIAGVENESQLGDVAGELRDRYGDPPPPVRSLLDYAALKLVCQGVGVAGVERKRDQVHVRFTEKAEVDPGKLAKFVASNKGAQFTPAGILKFTLRATRPEEVLRGIRDLLEQLAADAVAIP
jgi:transcription-repair coupling factor (superfamily II helicase)